MIMDLASITRAYLEPHRKYHTLDHIIRLLNAIRDFDLTVTDEQIAAIWYHDVVYNPQSGSNEEMSAYFAGEQLRAANVDGGLISTVEMIILDTKDHLPRHEQSKLVIDLDLMGLGDPVDAYFATGELIREEYSHLTEAQWIDGRKKFLEKFLSRSRIFQTEWGVELFEENARRNMNLELSAL